MEYDEHLLAGAVHLLPAYVALERQALGRLVVVTGEANLDGCRRLLAAGARRIFVVGTGVEAEPGIEVHPPSVTLPLRDASVDLILCTVSTPEIPALEEARRVLRPEGILALYLPSGAAEMQSSIDEALRVRFSALEWLALSPWRGLTIAPLPETESDGLRGCRRAIFSDEFLDPPSAPQSLLVLGFVGPKVAETECVLLALPGESKRSGPLEKVTSRGESSAEEQQKLRHRQAELERSEEVLSRREEALCRAEADLARQSKEARAAAAELEARKLTSLTEAASRPTGQGLASAEAEEREEAAAAKATAKVAEREEAAAAEVAAKVAKREEAAAAEVAAKEAELEEAAAAEVAAKIAELEEAAAAKEAEREEAAAAEVAAKVAELEEAAAAKEAELEAAAAAEVAAKVAKLEEAAAAKEAELEEAAAAKEAELEEAAAAKEAELEGAAAAEVAAKEAELESAAKRAELEPAIEADTGESEAAIASAALEEKSAALALREQALEEREAALESAKRDEKQTREEKDGEKGKGEKEEIEVLRQALIEREAELARLRSGTSSLEGEGHRVGADIALDRDRLREELVQRSAALQASEEQLWLAREAAQKERIENVRLVAEVDRLREQVERGRGVERDRLKEIESLGHELRRLEVAHAELQGLLEGKSQRIRELEERVQGVGAEVDSNVQRLREELREARTEIERVRSREQAGSEQANRREREAAEAQQTISQLRRAVDDYAAIAANLRGELVVIQVEVEQLQSLVPTLKKQTADLRGKLKARDDEAALLQQKLESAMTEQQHLRKRLRERKRRYDVLLARHDGLEAEVEGLRAELEAVKLAMAQIESAASATDLHGDQTATGLRQQLAGQARRFADELERIEARRDSVLKAANARLDRAQLEAHVRAEEQEFLLFRVDTCEQRIWEMTDASDRSAARLAAGLAQYAKQKEQLEDLVHELEVSRDLLAEAESRVAELERNLASERVRLARQGIESSAKSLSEMLPRGLGSDASAMVTDDAVFGEAEFDAPLHLDDELLRMTDAILDGEAELVQPMVSRRTDDEYDRELEEILASATGFQGMPSLGLGEDVDNELIEDVEAAMASSRAATVVMEPAAVLEPEAWIESSAEGDGTGIIIEMLDDEAWPDDWAEGGVGSGPALLSTDSGSSDTYIDIDLFEGDEVGPGSGHAAIANDEEDEEEAVSPRPSAVAEAVAAVDLELSAAALRALAGPAQLGTELSRSSEENTDDTNFDDVFDLEMPALVKTPDDEEPTEAPTSGLLARPRELPDLPGVPGVPELPGVREVPGVPGLPELPELPEMSRVPSLSGMPEPSGVTAIPDMAKLPGILEELVPAVEETAPTATQLPENLSEEFAEDLEVEVDLAGLEDEIEIDMTIEDSRSPSQG
ncbi:MAG TPA: hypothetical protein ENJ18_00330, partial [Nannocystis exedens]|nr:hypothetical protein [Nannocystis exedens]